LVMSCLWTEVSSASWCGARQTPTYRLVTYESPPPPPPPTYRHRHFVQEVQH
jgi:hypothetical protein